MTTTFISNKKLGLNKAELAKCLKNGWNEIEYKGGKAITNGVTVLPLYKTDSKPFKMRHIKKVIDLVDDEVKSFKPLAVSYEFLETVNNKEMYTVTFKEESGSTARLGFLTDYNTIKIFVPSLNDYLPIARKKANVRYFWIVLLSQLTIAH